MFNCKSLCADFAIPGHIVVDVCAIKSAAVYVASTLATLGKTEIESKSRRYVLPLNNSGAKVIKNFTLEEESLLCLSISTKPLTSILGIENLV